ncbi:acyl-CoA dehydrogenase family protein [Sphingobium sp. YR768]|uniref:acyl-CoA dehydrogenase family protein n=1 Tax=Sphingobium sp. YR768 TaxID=1884365 RepID=UPI0008B15E36|nr:acyl-CoA dehydrogenase family protein [Sphingobium sp. YR768]SES12778.1 Acyl-CoA dehydrogenase [Sphingobium sp. YR768]
MKTLRNFEHSRGWTDEERAILDEVERLSREVIAPKAADFDSSKSFPWSNIDALRSIGLFGIFVPEKYGGLDISYRCGLEIGLLLAQACASTGIIVGATAAAVKPIVAFGSEDQKARLLPRIANGSLAALAITEPHAGSDATAMRTRFAPQGDDVVVDGGKIFITNGDVADLVLLFGRWSEPGSAADGKITALVVERGAPGFDVVRIEDKMGTRASSTAELAFAECRVPRSNLLGDPGQGLKVLLSTLMFSRPTVAAHALGIAASALSEMLAYGNERHQGGKPIMEHQAISFMVADLAADFLAARTLLDHVGKLADTGVADFSIEASMIKLKASDLAMRMTTDAVQVFGGHGYIKGQCVERLMRDAKITQIWEGTNQIQRATIARDLTASPSQH